MSRRFDELLRAWVDEGEEILPYHYLDSALRQVVDTPQRSARRAALRRYLLMTGLTRTFERPFARYGVLAAAAVATIIVAVGLFHPSVLPVGETSAPHLFTESDLDQIVLGKTDAPPQADYKGRDPTRPLLLPVWYLSEDQQQRFINLRGYVGGATADFRGGAGRGGAYLFVSAALLFEDADSASAALAAYDGEIRTGWGLANPEPSDPGLGQESLLFSGPAGVQDGQPGFYYFWRVDNLVLEAVGVGPVDGERLTEMGAAVRTMALEMERRAAQT